MNANTTLHRRQFLELGAIATAAALLPSAAHAAPLRLLFVHGRSQQGLEPDVLKAEWQGALEEGLQALGRSFPADVEVAFPYYGDVLDQLSSQNEVPLVSDIQAKGTAAQDEYLAFQALVAESIRERVGITEEQVDAEYGANAKPRGPLNWEWVQAILRAIDKHGGGLGLSAIETFTRDVFFYATRAGVKTEIDRIVAAELTEEPTVIVGHSLGSVVAYNVLRSDPRNLKVPLLVTLGCPLGIRAIRRQFQPIGFPLPPVDAWFNAFDNRDVVALYALDHDNFPVTPVVENFDGVQNSTENRHGAVGYLSDRAVADRIASALGI